jgi:hypothetical protein
MFTSFRIDGPGAINPALFGGTQGATSAYIPRFETAARRGDLARATISFRMFIRPAAALP